VAEKRIALVIGSGAVKCTAALGLQKALKQAGLGIDMVVGCSGGSIYAALIALGYMTEEAEQMTYRLWTREITSQRDRLAYLKVLFPRLLGFDGQFSLIKDTLILERLSEAFGDRSFDDTRIPLHIVATDLMDGNQVEISNGRLVDAIRASIAIPFIFKPWSINGRLLIDGAMSNPLPIDVAIKEGADIIIALGFEGEMQTYISSILRLSFQVTTVMSNNLLKSNMAFQQLAHHAEVITVMPLFEERIKAFDTSKIPALIEAGETAMKQDIPYIHTLLDL